MKRHMKNNVEAKVKCTGCGNQAPIRRNLNRERTQGHVKDLYCYKCKKEMPHLEVREEDALAQIWR